MSRLQLALTYFFWSLVEADVQTTSVSVSAHNTVYSSKNGLSSSVINPSPVGRHYTSTIGTTINPTKAPQNGCAGEQISSFSICWVDYPPYLMKDGEGNMTGVFHDAFKDIINKCCRCCGINSSNSLNYSREAMNFTELSECMKSDEIDFVFPVLGKHVKRNPYNKARFQELFPSPGIAVSKNRTHLEQGAKWNVIHEFFQTWTVLVLTLLLNAIFGILIWALDFRSNPKEFPPSFCRGSLEGIWWAFVTMTTVGYGDKAPKFLLARVLSVVWMFMGVAVMAYLTAIMTTALTSGTVKDHKVIVNKKLGVLAGSQGHSEGIKQGAIVEQYNDLEALSAGLSNNEVEGILLDVFTTNYLSNKHPKYSDILEQVRILEFPFSIGIYMVHLLDEGHIPLHYCIKTESETKIELDIYPAVLKYIRASTIQDTESTWWGTRLNLFGASQVAFQKTLYILLSILAALIAMGLLWELFSRQKRRTLKLHEKGKKSPAPLIDSCSPDSKSHFIARFCLFTIFYIVVGQLSLWDCRRS